MRPRARGLLATRESHRPGATRRLLRSNARAARRAERESGVPPGFHHWRTPHGSLTLRDGTPPILRESLLDATPDVQDIKRFIKPVMHVPDTMKVDDLFQEMKREKQHMAIVTDEYGGTDGLVTIEDITHASVFLLENRGITGVNLRVDGGRMMK